MKTRFTAIALHCILILSLAFAGCGEKAVDEKDDSSVSADELSNVSVSDTRFFVKMNKKGSLVVTDYTGTDKELSIPAAIDKYAVVTIGTEAFKDCTKLEKVIIPSSVTDIQSNAFVGCTALKEVVIPEGVTSIRTHVFGGCTALKEITLPASLTNISPFAFEDTVKGFTIKGKAGSYAESFAKNKGIKFVAI